MKKKKLEARVEEIDKDLFSVRALLLGEGTDRALFPVPGYQGIMDDLREHHSRLKDLELDAALREVNDEIPDAAWERYDRAVDSMNAVELREALKCEARLRQKAEGERDDWLKIAESTQLAHMRFLLGEDRAA